MFPGASLDSVVSYGKPVWDCWFLMMLIRAMCKPCIFLCTNKGKDDNVSDQSGSMRES